ncbi:FHA domain-containing protein FhaB [Posidoniimonas polymericola]|uniref:FHA domain-containing protein FhaB n=1 Tax=Posidoniimonas polymericola TaxID=2528002 RepID=A0A5C5YM92_9BACT|nr:FHA domain-containing protein [Posidoniimonas polymericola]TWT76083.1 FHA domain-containing protein FhaB [Posidoniimonas polymericola]
MKLKVLAGAKEGTEIPLKRSKFLIGRSSECTLRAGSDAISRRHCVVLTRESGVSVRDLGSRNGTLVNGERIESETPLSIGDRLKVGPLEFEMIAAGAELKSAKKPPVKSVAEAVDRAANQAAGDVAEDDISNWLLGGDPTSSVSMRETMSFRVDETRSSKIAAPAGEAATDADAEDVLAEGGEEAEHDSGSDKKDKKDKKRFGKLPELPKKPGTKDSREAAADILREMSRRR